MQKVNKIFFLGPSVLIGTVVGAGIFGLPYVVSRSGIVPGLFYFLILGGAVLLIHLFFGEVILRTEGKCRLPGLVQKYLGKKEKILTGVSVIVGITGALLAYIILAGDFLKILFSSLGNFSSFQLAFVFWIVLSFFIFRGIKTIAPAEIFTNILFFLVIFVIIGFCLPKFDLSNFALINPSASIFLPYGVILFSLIGWSAIPEMIEIFKTPEEKKNTKKVIILSTIIILFLYFCFIMAVLGVSGKVTSFDTLSGLLPFLGEKIIFFGALAGVITLADSFLVLGLYLRNTFIYDLKFSKNLSFLISCGVPFLLYFLGLRSFITTIGFVGTIIGAIEGIIIILIFKKAKILGERTPEYSLNIPSFLLYFLILILILGAISQIYFYL
ncbi:MAG: aromatic amino acid transport family protein [Candidatus Pacebacteria bacterium]|nr:aromatic amino acid transport family protein [Candidatus Paceibacterota bacterium]